ncbi:NAD-dependent epimerase/dehydratase family protein [Planococcus liqunii]|uniref:NAD-dependent epimerase/dehydratase family protein n=1 Tax=Planococcus liqunii TaxID=3058394 RepID=UPI0026196923|nr:NAD-dependent epimerase/dehydratase family protein [Planococcus sp. N056]WKA50221.1 NAD-dependent epimerase/dehydratase family protein [Planococcus sp. N056]
MKVLITGENSYAGTQFAKRISELNMNWDINYISVRNNAWKEKDFSIYDAIYHVAAIVHQKEKVENEELYYKVNRDLTYELAGKAKSEGVESFVFLSTMAVYGLIGKIGEDTVISKSTKQLPTSYYGKSKLEAEELLNGLQSSEFKISILRIPIIYGPDCPGNYRALSKLARKTPVFPKINNRRSMIFVDHLSDVVIHLINIKSSGMFLVKNPEDVDTLKMVNKIAENHHKKVYNSTLLGSIIKVVGNKVMMTRKMFGNVVFDASDCRINGFKFNELSFEESIALAEGKEQGGSY